MVKATLLGELDLEPFSGSPMQEMLQWTMADESAHRPTCQELLAHPWFGLAQAVRGLVGQILAQACWVLRAAFRLECKGIRQASAPGWHHAQQTTRRSGSAELRRTRHRTPQCAAHLQPRTGTRPRGPCVILQQVKQV